MIHAYDEMYIDGAMIRMGDMLEYAVLDLNMDPDSFFKMFLDSSISRKFEIGNVSIVAGKSGPEIALMILDEIDHKEVYTEPTWREDRSDVFWAGWTMAYFQWYENKPFRVIWKDVPIRTLLKMYATYHEADLSKAVESMKRMMHRKESKSIFELRTLRGWTQTQLAEMAGMSISQLQRLEYGERKTDNMTLKSAIALANALGIEPEELLSKDESIY